MMAALLLVILRIILVLVVLALSLAAAGFAFFTAARFVSTLILLTAVAGLVLLLVAGGGAWLVTRQTYWTLLIAGGWLVMAAVLVKVAFPPLDFPYEPPAPLPNMAFWELPTGSRLAYTHIAAEGAAKETPIIFLHGGPGWVILEGDVRFYSQLAGDGYDVYLYDQVGSGRSIRLGDVREYTTERHVADLEAIREAIGAEQVILIGQSWGNTLAADYMAAYPQRVSKVIFASPGAMWDVGRFRANYTGTANVSGGGPALPPLRVPLTVLLIGRNPILAGQIASERELESFFNTLPSASVLGQNYCLGDEAKVPDIEIRGSNQYVNRLTFASQESYPDPRPTLRQNQTPALILRGECEFMPRALAEEYEATLPNAQLVEVAGAGHSLIGSQPEQVLSLMRAFLAGRDG
jgi:proline iminopeptidase